MDVLGSYFCTFISHFLLCSSPLSPHSGDPMFLPPVHFTPHPCSGFQGTPHLLQSLSHSSSLLSALSVWKPSLCPTPFHSSSIFLCCHHFHLSGTSTTFPLSFSSIHLKAPTPPPGFPKCVGELMTLKSARIISFIRPTK